MLKRRLLIGAGFCVHNEEDYIAYSMRAVYDFADIIAVSINTGTPWGGQSEELDSTLDIVKSFPDPAGKIRLQTGEWKNEIEQRTANLNLIRGEIDYYMIVDADEIYDSKDLHRLKSYIAWRPYIGQFRMRLNTYWKANPFYKIEPPENLRAYVISRVHADTRFINLRRTNEQWRITVPRKVAICHHFSYARPSEKILQKLRNFSHKDEVLPNWYENVWLAWDANSQMTDLHPVRPSAYKRASRVSSEELPDVIRGHPFAEPR